MVDTEEVFSKKIAVLYGTGAGRPAVVLADGPTARDADSALLAERLKGSPIYIGTNRTLQLVEGLDYWIVADLVIWEALYRQRGAAISVCSLNLCRYAPTMRMPKPDYGFVPLRDFDHPGSTLMSGGGSALMALHFAWRLGCSPIVIAGFDCGPVNGEWYCVPTPIPPDRAERQAQYRRFHAMIAGTCREIKARGVNVLNMSAVDIEHTVSREDFMRIAWSIPCPV